MILTVVILLGKPVFSKIPIILFNDEMSQFFDFSNAH